MGVLRLLLALSVVIAHSSPIFGLRLVDGTAAVQAFFVISGFYMFMILSEKYHSYRTFIASRALRLWPVYSVVAAFTLVYSLILYKMGDQQFLPGISQWIGYWEQMSLSSKAFLIFANIAMIGQDWTYFMGLDPSAGTLYFTDDFMKTKPGVGYFILVPQAWSLGIELLFYLVVPFLVVKRSWMLLAIFTATILIRWAILKAGVYRDPWSYRFFPAELGLFVLGGLSYRLYAWLRSFQEKILSGAPPVIATALVLGYVFVYYSFPFDTAVRQWTFYLVTAAALPFVFHLSRNSSLDRYVGELSYPVYIVHFVILSGTSCLANQAPSCGPIGAVASILLSIVLLRYVQDPIDRFRHKRFS